MSAAGDEVRPWLGLLPYGEEDQALFYGREQDTADLLRLVRREVLTVLFGRSGTGKSSLLKAGLFPRLREERCLPVWIRLEHSGKSGYGRQIREALREAADTHGMELEVLNVPLADAEVDFWEYLHRVVIWDPRNQPVTPVLVFDQFEEFFTIGRNHEEIPAFLDELCGLVENHIPCRVREQVEAGNAKLPASYSERTYKVVITLREDFVSRLDDLRKDMPSVMHNRHALKQMSGEQALEVVLKPGGDLVDEDVGRKIVRFVSAANETEISKDCETTEDADFQNLQVEPALLSLVCSELNLQRLKRGGEKITLEQVQTSGDRILDDFYERCLSGLNAPDRPFIEDRLVTGGGFRTAVPLEEAITSGLTEAEVDRLIDRRLLRKEDRLGIPHIELTHDVLTRVVTRSRQFRREREEIEAERLMNESDLREREKLVKERQREAKSRRARRARWIATGLAVVFAGFAFSTYRLAKAAEKARDEAREAKSKAEARALALKAVDTSKGDPELAVLLAIESAISDLGKEANGAAAQEIELALRTATRESLIRTRYQGHTAKIYSVDFDKSGKRLVTGGGYPDSTARIWDVESGQEIVRLDHAGIPGIKDKGMTVSCARFSPDGKQVVTATYQDGGHLYLWDVDTRGEAGPDGPAVITRPIGDFLGHDGWVTAVAFSPDGGRVASGGYDKVVRVWDPATQQELMPPLDGHTDRIRTLVFSADGRKILTASDDGTAILWNLESGPDGTMEKQVFDAYADRKKRENLHAADLSPQAKLVATAGNDGFLRVWDVVTGLQVASHSHPDGVMGVAFIDDDRLATVCNDATIRFWEMADAVEDDWSARAVGSGLYLNLIASQRGHEDWIRALAVSPDKRFIATASSDKSVRRWALPQGGEVGVLGGYGRGFYWCADAWAEKDKLTVFAGMGNGEIRAMDGWTGKEIEGWGGNRAETPQHSGSVRSLFLSPDGTRLVTASQDQTAIVWDAGTGQSLFPLTGHQGENGGTVYHARFSPDGKRVVTASDDGSAMVWQADKKPANGNPELMLIPGDGEYDMGDINDAAGLAAAWLAHADSVSGFVLQTLGGSERAVLERADGGTSGEEVQKQLLKVLNELVSGKPLRNEAAFLPSGIAGKIQAMGPSASVKVVNRLLLDNAYPGHLKRFRPTVYDARFSEDGGRIVTADFQAATATLWDTRNAKPLLVLPGLDGNNRGHGDSVVGASFSPDGSQVVTACMDGFCRIWDSRNGDFIAAIPHRVAVRSAEFSPDGKWILTSAADGVARVFSVPGYKLRSELRGHRETSPDAHFDKGGRYIVSSSRDGTVKICYSDPWDLYALATHRITRKLTRSELRDYQIKRELSAEEKEYYRKEREAGR